MASNVLGRGGGAASSGGVPRSGTGHALVETVQSEELKDALSGEIRSGESPNGSESSASFSSVSLYTVLEDRFDGDALGTRGAGTRLIVENL